MGSELFLNTNMVPNCSCQVIDLSRPLLKQMPRETRFLCCPHPGLPPLPMSPGHTHSSSDFWKEEGGKQYIWIVCPFLRGMCTYIEMLSVQFSSVAQSCPTLPDPMNHSMPGLPVHHELPEFTQTHVHRVSDAIQPSHPLSSPSPPASNPSQHQSLFQ